MNEYQKQALDFLEKSQATMDIEFRGLAINKMWDDNRQRNLYAITLKTPRGTMQFDFWDSLYSTEITQTTNDIYATKRFGRRYQDLSSYEQSVVRRELQSKKKKAVPTPYDVLACLTKSDPGTFKNFCAEYGYNDDSIKDRDIYFAVQEEWDNLRRIFTPEQLEELAEIN